MYGTGHRHLSGAAPPSDSYVSPFLCDRLVVKCSLPDLPSFCTQLKSLHRWQMELVMVSSSQ